MKNLIKNLLLGILLVVAFTSCDEEVYLQPERVETEALQLAHQADTVQMIVVETENEITYFNASTDPMTVELKIIKEDATKFAIGFVTAMILLWAVFIVIGIIKD